MFGRGVFLFVFFVLSSGFALAEEPWQTADLSCDDCLKGCIHQHPFDSDKIFKGNAGIDDERKKYHENYNCAVKCMTTKCSDVVNSNHEIINPVVKKAVDKCIKSQTAKDNEKSFPNFSACELDEPSATHICREECYFSKRWKTDPSCRTIQTCSDCIACCDTPQAPGIKKDACQKGCRESVCSPDGDIKKVVNRPCTGDDANLKVGSSATEAPFSEIPVYSQMSTPSCYSFAAAALIDSYRLTHLNADTSHLTDPFLFHYINNQGNSVEAGGNSASAVAYTKQNGLCNHRAIFQKNPFAFKTPSIDATGALAICNDAIKHFYEDPRIEINRADFQSRFKNIAFADLDDIQTWFDLHPEVQEAYNDLITKITANTAACSVESLAISKEGIQNSIDGISAQILSKMGAFGPSYVAVCAQVFKEFCKERSISVQLPDYDWFNTDKKTAGPAYQNIRDQIAKKLHAKLPTIVSFCAHQTVTQPPYYNSLHSTAFNTPAKEVQCGSHAVLVIGQRTMKDADGNTYCKYLIRNSWGKDCGTYHEKRQQDCEDGDLWIDSQDLLTSSQSVLSFKVEPKK